MVAVVTFIDAEWRAVVGFVRLKSFNQCILRFPEIRVRDQGIVGWGVGCGGGGCGMQQPKKYVFHLPLATCVRVVLLQRSFQSVRSVFDEFDEVSVVYARRARRWFGVGTAALRVVNGSSCS